MIIPARVKIGGHWIDVKLEKDGRDSTDGSAQYHNWYHLIKVRTDGTPESKQAEALLHEILQVIDKKYQLELSHQSLTTLSEVLFQTMRDSDLDFTFKGDI